MDSEISTGESQLQVLPSYSSINKVIWTFKKRQDEPDATVKSNTRKKPLILLKIVIYLSGMKKKKISLHITSRRLYSGQGH